MKYKHVCPSRKVLSVVSCCCNEKISAIYASTLISSALATLAVVSCISPLPSPRLFKEWLAAVTSGFVTTKEKTIGYGVQSDFKTD